MSTEQSTYSFLSVSNLSLIVESDSSTTMAITDLSFNMTRGQTLAVVGESGSGKTLLALAVMRLLPPAVSIQAGEIQFGKKQLLKLSESEMQRIRGNRISMIFQEPTTALNPLMSVGEQIGESIRLHQGLDRRSVREQVLTLMETVGISDPRRRYRSYPHQLSGGLRQRVLMATALSCRPDLLLADDPTSALDTTVQAQIVDLLSRLKRDLGMSLLLITHDLGVVAALADRVIVLFGGHMVEEGNTEQILSNPLHPYTQTLLAARSLTKKEAQFGRFFTMEFGESGDGRHSQCPFIALCPNKRPSCGEKTPGLVTLTDGRKVRCVLKGTTNG
jgi:oligopeptide/dipeptide ABC transporter ATP-binding protein